MRVLGLSFVSLLASSAVAQSDFDFAACGKEDADVEKCAQKIDSVVEVTPGISYFSKIACKDCPYMETWNEDSDDGKPESRITHGDQELVSIFPNPKVAPPWMSFINHAACSSSTLPSQTIQDLSISTARRSSRSYPPYHIRRTSPSPSCIQTFPTRTSQPRRVAKTQHAPAR